jgi:hypothetical protein
MYPNIADFCFSFLKVRFLIGNHAAHLIGFYNQSQNKMKKLEDIDFYRGGCAGIVILAIMAALTIIFAH